jgi:hypothetical protein
MSNASPSALRVEDLVNAYAPVAARPLLAVPPLRLHAPEAWGAHANAYVRPSEDARREALVLDTRRLEPLEAETARQGDLPARWVGWWVSLAERLVRFPLAEGATVLVALRRSKLGPISWPRADVRELAVMDVAYKLSTGEFALCWGAQTRAGAWRLPIECAGAVITLPGRGGAIVAADRLARAALAPWFP